MKPMYTATGTATGGGREGHASSADGILDLTLAPPRAMGGSGAGTNPEQLFAVGYAACFLSAMHFVGRGKKLDMAGAEVTGNVTIGQRDDGPGFMLAVKHQVRLPALAQPEAQALVDEAHQVCPYSNATRGNVEVTFEVEGKAA